MAGVSVPSTKQRMIASVAVPLAVTLLSACSGTDSAAPASTTQQPAAPVTTAAASTPTTPEGTGTTAVTGAPVATNRFFPLEAGYQSVRQGRLNRGRRELEHRRVFTVTNVRKEIDGKQSVLVLDQDFDGGEVAEQALDYLSIDPGGNVLYLGSYTESYEGGQFVNAADAWLAGVRGAVVGTLVPGAPAVGTPSFVQVDVPGQEKSTAKVIKTGEKVCVPFKCYTDVLVIQEGDEHKYFAPSVGGIKTEPNYSGGEQEVEELVNLTVLSPQGLAELSAEARRLDEHARTTAPKVFGSSKPAEQPS